MSDNRVQLEISLGAILLLVSAVFLLILGFQEEAALASAEDVQHAEAVEVGAILFVHNCAECHGEHGEGLIGPPLNDAYFFNDRLKDVGWGSTLEAYIISVVSAGRTVSTRPDLYPGQNPGVEAAMPTWSIDYGGPLRNDQIHDIAQYILNWKEQANGEYEAEILSLPAPLSADPVARGKFVYNSAGACGACHTIEGLSVGVVGPVLDGIATTAAERQDGVSAEDYLRESILVPGAYVVDDFLDGQMPVDFADRFSDEQFEDLITFLMTLE